MGKVSAAAAAIATIVGLLAVLLTYWPGLPVVLPFAADLHIANTTTGTLYVTPLGLDADRRYHLLPVLTERSASFYYSRHQKDFRVPPSSTLTVTFDHDDCQFAGVILVSDGKGMRSVVLTEDCSRVHFYYPPMEDSYVITPTMLTSGTSQLGRFSELFERFGVR